VAPPTETASADCRPAAETNVASMNQHRTKKSAPSPFPKKPSRRRKRTSLAGMASELVKLGRSGRILTGGLFVPN
jgi:hypothetical protein